jgi:hypothetical protein
VELWFACKLLASSLCIEARLLTQIFDTSSQMRLEAYSTFCSRKRCGRDQALRLFWKSDIVVLHLKVASIIRGYEACGVMILFSMPGAENIVPAISTLHSLASSRRPTHVCVCVCVRTSARCSHLVQMQPEVRLAFSLRRQ